MPRLKKVWDETVQRKGQKITLESSQSLPGVSVEAEVIQELPGMGVPGGLGLGRCSQIPSGRQDPSAFAAAAGGPRKAGCHRPEGKETGV